MSQPTRACGTWIDENLALNEALAATFKVKVPTFNDTTVDLSKHQIEIPHRRERCLNIDSLSREHWEASMKQATFLLRISSRRDLAAAAQEIKRGERTYQLNQPPNNFLLKLIGTGIVFFAIKSVFQSQNDQN